eukprot:COSAG02_NODE_70587_length_195_cov_17.802083_1_plen_28_part_01
MALLVLLLGVGVVLLLGVDVKRSDGCGG